MTAALDKIEVVRAKLVPADFFKQQFSAAQEAIYSRAIDIHLRATIVVRPTAEGRVTSTFNASTPVTDLVLTNNTAIVSNTFALLPVVIDVAETVFVTDSAPVSPATNIAVAETVFVGDSAGVMPAPIIVVSEHIVVTDAAVATPQATLTVLPATATSTVGITHTLTAIAADSSDPDSRVVVTSNVDTAQCSTSRTTS